MKWRTFPPTRANADELLASLGLLAYNRWGIVRKTHGVMADDEIWLRFEGEALTHKDVCLRRNLYYPEETSIAEWRCLIWIVGIIHNNKALYLYRILIIKFLYAIIVLKKGVKHYATYYAY